MNPATIAARFGQALMLSRGLSYLILKVITSISRPSSVLQERTISATRTAVVSSLGIGSYFLIKVKKRGVGDNLKISTFVSLSILFAREVLVYTEEGRD